MQNNLDCPLVLVEWEDSAQPVSSWEYLSDFKEPEIVKCASVRWLMHDGESAKALAPNFSEIGQVDNMQVSGTIRIPAKSIIKITKLKEVKEKT